MHFASTLHARRKGLRTLANQVPSSRSLPYDEAIEKGPDVPLNCHRASSCSDIVPSLVIQPSFKRTPFHFPKLAHSLTGASRRMLSPGGHKVPVHDRGYLHASLWSRHRLFTFLTSSWTSSSACTVRRHPSPSSSCLYVFV